MAEQTKKCPMCAEQIPLAAVTCEYCGTRFEVGIEDGRLVSKFIEEVLPEPAPPAEMKPSPLPERRENSWLLIPIILFIIGGVGGLLLFAGNALLTTPLAKPTVTRAPTHLPTRTPNHKATTQAQNTRAAATAQLAWVDSFAEPILSDVEGRSPNFEDDFSDMNGRFARWSYLSGSVTFTEGVMRINTTGQDGASAGGSMVATHFVLEFEFTPHITSDGSSAATGIRWNDSGGYGFNLNLNDPWCGLLSIPVEKDVSFVAEGWSREAGLNRRTSVTIIAKDKRFAFYANGEPLLYAEDSSWTGEWVDIGVWAPNGPAEVDFDNVKFWDLNNLKP